MLSVGSSNDIKILYEDTTVGHRFMAPGEITVSSFDDYKKQLEAAKVLIDPADRMTAIAHGADLLASEKCLELVEDAGLLAEVAGLVEWPVPLMGGFDPAFLEVPEEVLQLTMKKDQKYFALRDPKTGKLAPHFITVANLETNDGGALIVAGNEKVIGARLSDARFFLQQDLKGKLDDLLPNLKDIVFHKELGTVAERVSRIRALAVELAPYCGADADDAARAAELCKADLTSNMVYEFPEVQGVMGRHYALAQGEKPEVADAIRDHYAPAGPSDDCPYAPVSIAVALAEKIDTLTGFFGIDQRPTGSKDPFALRRAALGVIRLITENNIRMPLLEVMEKHFTGRANPGWFDSSESANWGRSVPDPVIDLMDFFADRLKVQQKDKGVRHDLIEAVVSSGGDDDLVRILARVAALQAFVDTEDGANLLAGYKRAANITEKADEDDFGKANKNLLPEKADQLLFHSVSDSADAVKASLEKEDYTGAMEILAGLRGPIDRFFEEVMVNADDPAIRTNRLAMLNAFTGAVNQVADFSKIEG